MNRLTALSFLGATLAIPVFAAKTGVKEDPFEPPRVFRIQIDISRSGIAALRNTAWGNGQERPTVKAVVREGTNVFTDVAVHLKGAAGSFRPIDQNPCLTLNFDKFVPGQSFHGLDKISLNNSVQDRSFLCEKISRELFEASGVPVPRAGHAKLVLNGRDLGLYVLTEGYNQQFLKRYFKNTKGNLYDGGFLRDITQPLGLNSGANPDDHSGLKALVAAVSERDSSARWERLEQTLDLDRFISFVAMDVIECDWDGYAMNRNNWRVFHDLDSNKMVFFPHGLDQMFGVERATPDCPILPHMAGMVARAVITIPEGRRRYLERMAQLSTNVFQVDRILKRVDQLAAVIRPVLAESNQQFPRYHDEEVRRLKQRIAQRGESIKNQLATVANPVSVANNGAVPLTGWKPRTMSGTPSMREQPGQGRNPLLYIGSTTPNTTGSWRTKVLLEEGSYQFRGRLRTADVQPIRGESGAGLRISGRTLPHRISGTVDWQMFSYPFQVGEDTGEVELICELSAAKGEVWFDARSLQIVRVR